MVNSKTLLRCNLNMKNIGVLWDDEVEWDRETPFDGASNESYSYFSERAFGRGVRLLQAKYIWYEDGVLEKAWIYDGDWRKVEDISVEGVFDKFHFDEETKKLKKKIDSDVGILNNPDLEELCKDKLMTYRKFGDKIPESRKFTREDAQEMLERFGKIVLKPRFAFGGKGIHIIEEGEDIPEVEDDYIVQRFVDSSSGVEGIIDGTHDLRAIIVDNELKAGYVRYSEDGEISNVSQGGSKHAVSPENFPDSAFELIEDVNEEIDYEPCLFSVDMFFDEDGNPWIVELNSKPGIGFYGDEEMKRNLEPVMDGLAESFKKI